MIMNRITVFFCFLLPLFIAPDINSAVDVPPVVQQPGTQPLEIGNLESPNKCDNCHGGYNSSVEPAHNWQGSMMSHAGRDPIFWATVAIAEQDFDGAGDLCIRCHSTGGWLAGRSTPTDGSGLTAGDSDGVECDYCHKLTNPDNSEHLGVMNDPFFANDGEQGYYGSGMSSMWGGSDKLGPYDNADARHQFMESKFHRDVDFCGTCHDVSNPVVGDLAPNHGVLFSQEPIVRPDGSQQGDHVAFNNPPYRYGVVERTFSEYKSGLISQTKVDDYPTLPEDLKGGALEAIYNSATNGGTTSADYQNPEADRFYSCQTCHMRPVTGTGANKRGVPVRRDLPLHDMTGGNYWMPSVIKYLDGQGKLVLGGGMTSQQTAAMDDGALRAEEQLRLAASLKVEGHSVEIINHTGHKLISGYPEGRRMWLNIKWYDSAGNLLREDGEYGQIGLTVNDKEVESIKNLDDPYLHIYEAHMGMTSDWANGLLGLFPDGLALSYNRMSMSGNPVHTLAELAAMAPGESLETFHFVLNNTVIKDNRIPPYGMSYDEAKRRNASPVPPDQYEGSPGGVYKYYDEVDLSPPAGAKTASIDLLYQPTSWEYIQFLYLANKQSGFLGQEGINMLDAWLNTGMAAPFVMASAAWRDETSSCEVTAPTLLAAEAADSEVSLTWSAPLNESVSDYRVYYDQGDKSQWVADVPCSNSSCGYTDTGLSNGQNYCYKVTASYKVTAPEEGCESDFSNTLCATPIQVGQQLDAGVVSIETGKWVTEGKGKNATETFVFTDSFAAGDEVFIQMLVHTESGTPVTGATVNLSINVPENLSIISGASDDTGAATAVWATQRPNKKGVGGTAEGSYTATVTTVNSTPYDWDGITREVSFTIGQTATSMMQRHH